MNDRPLDAYPPNGTSEDILSILARAEERRYRQEGTRMPVKGRGARRWLEPCGNAAGLALRWVIEALPARASAAIHDRVVSAMAGSSVLPFERGAPGLLEARELCADLERASGAPPALLAAMSHPPVTPEWLNLNVEMTRQILKALVVVRGRPCRPRMVVAVDPFALDMVPVLTEAAYAGFMGTYHLGFDRLARGRGAASRLLLGAASWERLPWRMLWTLSRGREAGLVLAGGVPTTARVLYTSREFLMRLRRARPPEVGPSEALRRLKAAEPAFARFLESPLVGGRLGRNAWRAMEAWLAATLVGQWPGASADRWPDLAAGRLAPEASAALRAAARALGIREPDFEAEALRFEDEFGRETPYRERFFRFLVARVVARGRPIVLVPLAYRAESAAGGGRRFRLEWGRPAALLKVERGRLRVRGSASANQDVGEFARDFVRVRYP